MKSIEMEIRRGKPLYEGYLSLLRRTDAPSAGVAEQMWITEQLVWAVAFVQEIQYPLLSKRYSIRSGDHDEKFDSKIH